MPFNRPLPAFFLLLWLATPALAQTRDGGPDPEQSRIRLGPLWVNPTISVPNIGIDSNVFNDPPTATPRSDFTVTVAPKAELWLRMGRTWLSGTAAEDIVWYEKYATERSTNHLLTIGWKAPFNRLVLFTGATWVNTRSRPGYEIDARVRRREPTYAASGEIRTFARTLIGARGSWRKVSYEDAFYDGARLKDELDRSATSAAVTLRHELTPLTTVTFSAGRSEQRFTSSSRSSESDDYSVSFNFDPGALLRGSATFGYTRYKPESADLPGYEGATFDVSLAYALADSTRFTAAMSRAIDFSYNNDQPYYVLSGGGGSIAQHIAGPVDAIARAGAYRLKYTSRSGASSEMVDRTDRVRSYGGGVGFRVGGNLRLGFNIDKERRTSILEKQTYEGLKYGASLTYGL